MLLKVFFFREHNDVDVPAAYHQLLDTYQSSESEEDNQEQRPSTSQGSSSRRNGTRRFVFGY